MRIHIVPPHLIYSPRHDLTILHDEFDEEIVRLNETHPQPTNEAKRSIKLRSQAKVINSALEIFLNLSAETLDS